MVDVVVKSCPEEICFAPMKTCFLLDNFSEMWLGAEM